MTIRPMDASVTLKGLFHKEKNKVDLVFYCTGSDWPSTGVVSIETGESFSISNVASIITNSIFERHGVRVIVKLSDPCLHGSKTLHAGTELRNGSCAIKRTDDNVTIVLDAYYATKPVSSLTFNFNVVVELLKEESVATLQTREQPAREIEFMDPNAARGLRDYHKDMTMMVLMQPHITACPGTFIPVFSNDDKDRNMEKETVPYTLRVNKMGNDYVIYARIAGAGNVFAFTRIPYHQVTLTMIAHISLGHSVGLAVAYAKWLSNKFKSLNALGVSKLKDMDSAKGVMDTPISTFYKEIASEDATHKQSAIVGLYQVMLHQLYHADINKALYLDLVPSLNRQPVVVQAVNLVSINHGQLDKYLKVMSPDVIEEAIRNHLRVELNANEAKHRAVVDTIVQLEAVRDSMKDDLKTYTENITRQIDNIDKDIAAKHKTLPIFDTTAEQIRALLGPEYQPKQGE